MRNSQGTRGWFTGSLPVVDVEVDGRAFEVAVDADPESGPVAAVALVRNGRARRLDVRRMDGFNLWNLGAEVVRACRA
jgi:hypothetical protein